MACAARRERGLRTTGLAVVLTEMVVPSGWVTVVVVIMVDHR